MDKKIKSFTEIKSDYELLANRIGRHGQHEIIKIEFKEITKK